MTRAASTTGPQYFIHLACFCQSAALDEKKLLTLTRVVGQVFLPMLPPERASAQFTLKFVLSVTPFPIDTPHVALLRLEFENPKGASGGIGEAEMRFRGGYGNGLVIFDAELTVQDEGVYWMRVSSGQTELTRVPLKIVYVPAEGAKPRRARSRPRLLSTELVAGAAKRPRTPRRKSEPS